MPLPADVVGKAIFWVLHSLIRSFVETGLFTKISHDLPSNRQYYLSCGACLEDKMEDNQNCSVQCMTVVHNDMHTRVHSYIFAC